MVPYVGQAALISTASKESVITALAPTSTQTSVMLTLSFQRTTRTVVSRSVWRGFANSGARKMATLRLDAADRTGNLIDYVTGQLDDETLDNIKVERQFAPVAGLASEPVTVAVTLTLGTTAVIAVARIIERWLENHRQEQAMSRRCRRVRQVRRGRKGPCKASRKSTQRCRFPMGSCGMARGSSPKDSRVSCARVVALRFIRNDASRDVGSVADWCGRRKQPHLIASNSARASAFFASRSRIACRCVFASALRPAAARPLA